MALGTTLILTVFLSYVTIIECLPSSSDKSNILKLVLKPADDNSFDHGSHALVKRSTVTNESGSESSNHGNSSQGNQGEGEHGEKHSIHLAVWNFEHVKSPFIIAAFIFLAGISKLGFHHADFLSSRVPESCLLIILGVVVGGVYKLVSPSTMPAMDADLFFLYLLPPIILESAYSLHDRTFYDNVGTVLIYAVIGTVLNCFMIGPSLFGLLEAGAMGSGFEVTFIQCLVLSAIIVAVDPVAVLAIFQEVGVNNTLYFLVFGESLLNDAVTVVLYNMMKTFNVMPVITPDQIVLGVLGFFVVSLGGASIGLVYGTLTAFITKYTDHCRVVEPLALFALAYLSYLSAEMFHFSGIISIICCGLTQAQYAFRNVSRKSYTTVKYFSKMMSATSDCMIFLFLGVSLFKDEHMDPANWHIGFIMWSIFLCLLFRFIVVFGLSFILNRLNRLRKIDLEEQFIMSYGGLRGAVAFSLVDLLHEDNLPKGKFETTTLAVIFFTVFVQGITIKPLVKLLRVKMEENKKLSLGEEINSHVTDHVMAGIEEILGNKGAHYVREVLEYYNNKYLKTWLQRDPISSDDQIMLMFEKIALQQHFENLSGSKMVIDKYTSDQIYENTSISDNEEPLSDDEESAGSSVVLPACTGVTVPLPLIKQPSPWSEVGSQSTDTEVLREQGMNGHSLAFQEDDVETLSEAGSQRVDLEIVHEAAERRRKSLFPVNLSKRRESRLLDNPRPADIRKIMMPTRKQLQFKRLDKNLKSDDSENDLLRYLEEKQYRTRKMSRALLQAQPTITEEPETQRPTYNRRKSAAAATNNYRRRLSLATPQPRPEDYTKKRHMSDGRVLKGIAPQLSPGRRRFKLKLSRSTSSESPRGSLRELTIKEEPESQTCPLKESEPGSPSVGLDIINEHSDEGYGGTEESPTNSDKGVRLPGAKASRLAFRKARTLDYVEQHAKDGARISSSFKDKLNSPTSSRSSSMDRPISRSGSRSSSLKERPISPNGSRSSSFKDKSVDSESSFKDRPVSKSSSLKDKAVSPSSSRSSSFRDNSKESSRDTDSLQPRKKITFDTGLVGSSGSRKAAKRKPLKKEKTVTIEPEEEMEGKPKESQPEDETLNVGLRKNISYAKALGEDSFDV